MSAASAALPWTPQQCEWLRAMGYALYAHGDPADAAATPDAAGAADLVEPPPASVPVAEAPAAAQRPPRAAPRDEADAVPPPPRGFARRPAARLPDRLQLALLRASGLDPSDPETQRLMASWPLAELRGNPAAKRALWPRLRALRRRSPP